MDLCNAHYDSPCGYEGAPSSCCAGPRCSLIRRKTISPAIARFCFLVSDRFVSRCHKGIRLFREDRERNAPETETIQHFVHFATSSDDMGYTQVKKLANHPVDEIDAEQLQGAIALFFQGYSRYQLHIHQYNRILKENLWKWILLSNGLMMIAGVEMICKEFKHLRLLRKSRMFLREYWPLSHETGSAPEKATRQICRRCSPRRRWASGCRVAVIP
jgi:hypothetical protein